MLTSALSCHLQGKCSIFLFVFVHLYSDDYQQIKVKSNLIQLEYNWMQSDYKTVIIKCQHANDFASNRIAFADKHLIIII